MQGQPVILTAGDADACTHPFVPLREAGVVLYPTPALRPALTLGCGPHDRSSAGWTPRLTITSETARPGVCRGKILHPWFGPTEE